MTADDDGLRPPRHQPRDVRDDDRLAEDHTTEDVADRTVRRPPHLLEAELLDPRLVRRDRCALDADAVLVDGVRGIDGHLVVRGVTVLDGQVEVPQIHVEVGMDQPVLDERPDDARHLVAVELDDRARYLDLCHPEGSPVAPWSARVQRSRTPLDAKRTGRPTDAGRRPAWLGPPLQPPRALHARHR